jgi:hypothetical protein
MPAARARFRGRVTILFQKKRRQTSRMAHLTGFVVTEKVTKHETGITPKNYCILSDAPCQ